MKLIRLDIEKLFGSLDYNIPLDENEITMLTGPNGYGKTMILNIMNCILSNSFGFLFSLKFKRISLYYQGGAIFIESNVRGKLNLINERSLGDNNFTETLVKKEGESSEYYRTFVSKLDCQNTPDKPKLVDQVIRSRLISKVFPEGFVSFIRSDRLDKSADGNAVIDACAERLRELMESAEDQSAALSQMLDATFPFRLFESLNTQKLLTNSNTQQRLIGIQGKRRDYMKFGLIKNQEELLPAEGGSMDGNREYLNVLDLYIQDAMKKLSPFENLHQKIDLFESILREKVLAFKYVYINREEGFGFRSVNGNEIERKMLSSGEQNQVVLLFCLIFDLVAQKVILIDEPEISLHVAWQQTFLASLEKIQKINQYEKVIIATHSPAIISKRWALTYDLYESLHNKGSEKSFENTEL